MLRLMIGFEGLSGSKCEFGGVSVFQGGLICQDLTIAAWNLASEESGIPFLCESEHHIVIYSYVSLVKVSVRLQLTALPFTDFIPVLNDRWPENTNVCCVDVVGDHPRIFLLHRNHSWLFFGLPLDHYNPPYQSNVFMTEVPLIVTRQYKYIHFLPGTNYIDTYCNFEYTGMLLYSRVSEIAISTSPNVTMCTQTLIGQGILPADEYEQVKGEFTSGYVLKMNATRLSNCQTGDDCCNIENAELFSFYEMGADSEISIVSFSSCGRLISHRLSQAVYSCEIIRMRHADYLFTKNDELEIQIAVQCLNRSRNNFLKTLEIVRTFYDHDYHDVKEYRYIWPGWIINHEETLGYIFPGTSTMLLKLEPTVGDHGCNFSFSYVYRQPVSFDVEMSASEVLNVQAAEMVSWKQARQECLSLNMDLIQVKQEDEFFAERNVLAE